ncbi:MAG TPA: alpha/beta hydrolase [Candidatus Limnocylindrales bacterium]|nr:alpha/beta hydrolase [Candidatus Limnocylindrales bacterium]
MTFTIEVPGARLNAADGGAGDAIVLLHAGVADLRSWDAMVPLLVDAGLRVIRYDLRGFGASEVDDVEFSNRADVMAVLDALDIERAALVGNSRGGHIAFDTAVEFPDRVVAVVGVGAGIGGLEHEPTPEEVAIFEEMERLEDAEPRDAEALADQAVRVWVDGIGQPPDRVAPEIRDYVRRATIVSYEPGKVAGRPIVLDPPAAARLADLRCPVLAVAGGYDTSFITAVAHHLERHAPNGRAVIWPDVAHMIGMERPAELAALIVDFLASMRPWR